jgi:L-asparaginase II
MAEPLRVAVRRGAILESVHEVHGVAVRGGEVVAAAGDASLMASLRSAAKPFQALPLARAYEGLDDELLAIAAASHFGTPRHVEVVRRLLAATGGQESELQCGLQEGRPAEAVYDNCSGKHAGMLAVCRANGWPVETYRSPEHPLQRLLRDEIASAAEVEPEEVATGTDGCGVVAFGIPLERAARAFSRLEELDGGPRVAAAMRAYPELIAGEGATDTGLMRSQAGALAKGGADGLLCVLTAEGTGIALKVADGNGRALRPALAVFGARVGLALPGFAEVPVPNRHGEPAATLSLL